MKMKIKKSEKMNSVFELSISKLDYIETFMKICWKKLLTYFLGHFWLIEAKWENESDFRTLHIKIRICDNFHENWRKNFDPFSKTFLTNRGKNEDEDEKNWKNGFHFWILHIKIRSYGTFHKNLQKKKTFFEIFTWERHTRKEVSRGLIDFLLTLIKIFCFLSSVH